MTAICNSSAIHLVDDTLVIVLAGGQGSRLHELTDNRAKPGLEFAGSYRIIDFPLSNAINSGLKRIGVVTQYKSQCLIRHLIRGWAKLSQNNGEFLELLPASQQLSQQWYRGTADSLYQNLAFIKSVKPKYVLVLSGDHVYKMDYREMLMAHVNSNAELTVSCIEVPIKTAAGQFGVMSVNEKDRVTAFAEKPIAPTELDDKPGYALASMGNYVFNADFLISQLEKDAGNRQSEHDFGKDIIPNIIRNFNVFAFRFRDQQQPNGIPYWRDVGTLDAYWTANIALLDQQPPINIYDENWPIASTPQCLQPVKFVCDKVGKLGSSPDSAISGGSVIHSSMINRSMVFENVEVEEGANIEESMLLPNVIIGEGAVIRRAIIDSGTHIPKNMKIGVDVREDIKNGFRVSCEGVVLVTQSMLDKCQAEHAKQSTQTQQAAKQQESTQTEPLPLSGSGHVDVCIGERDISVNKLSQLSR